MSPSKMIHSTDEAPAQMACCTPCQCQCRGSSPSQRLRVDLTSYGIPLWSMASSVAIMRHGPSSYTYMTSGVVRVMPSMSAAHWISIGSMRLPRSMSCVGGFGAGGLSANSSDARSAALVYLPSPWTAAATDAEIRLLPLSSDHLTLSHSSLPWLGFGIAYRFMSLLVVIRLYHGGWG